MKLPCQIIRDLIPLYEDGACSPESREAVHAHLNECEDCRALVHSAQLLPALDIQPEEPQAQQAVVSSFRKIRRRWRLSLIAMLVIIPICLFGYLGYQQFTGRGISFSNIDEAILANQFVNALEDGNYADAAALFDYSGKYALAQEELAQSVESYLPPMVRLTIGDEEWIVHEQMAELYLQDSSDPIQTWRYLAYNGIFGALIPEDAWCALITTAEEYRHTSSGAEILNGYRYRCWESMWGNYWVFEDVWDILADGDVAQSIISGNIQMVPYELYQDMEESLLQMAQESFDFVQALHADAAQMDEESYVTHNRQLYAQAIQSLDDRGYHIENLGLYSLYDVGSRTVITQKLRVHYGDESVVVYLDLECENGTISLVSGHYNQEAYWLHDFVNALYETF